MSVVIRGTTVFKSDWRTGYQEKKSKMIEQGLGLRRSGVLVLGEAEKAATVLPKKDIRVESGKVN